MSVGGPRNRPNSVATLTLAFDGDFTRNFELKVRVRPTGFAPTGGPNVDSHHSLTVTARNDYDVDDDGLIEISTLAQLNAVRWDLDGDGNPSPANADDYASAFLTSGATLGCPTTDADADDHDCLGYELADHLDFDTDGDDDVDANDTGSYTNWSPIGGAFSAIFHGNGYTIGHLTHNGSGNFGLFNSVSGTVRNLGLPDVNVTSGTADYVSSLAVVVSGRVIGSWASGRIFNSIPSSTGGLVAQVSVDNGQPIAPITVPAATGGDGGSYTYGASGLPPGLAFDATGTGACRGARTICGTPTEDGAFTVTAAAHDADLNTGPSDRATHVSPSRWKPSPPSRPTWPLTEATAEGRPLGHAHLAFLVCSTP